MFVPGLQNNCDEMFARDQYELLDVGDGRRLECFGAYRLDRPAPVARRRPRDADLWATADARFERTEPSQGNWSAKTELATAWPIRHEALIFELRCTPSGAIGIYPEQAANWDWIARHVRKAGRSLKVLNLFAYTGGSTLAAAAAGADVVHVDAARSVVNWARRNADLSGLGAAPIRWIVEDARRFVQRELRRGTQYDAVILDPPTYGHGPQAQPWKLDRHLAGLLRNVHLLTEERRAFILLTCHAPSMGPAELEAMLAEHLFGHCQAGVLAKQLTLRNGHGQRLPSGVVARWPGG